jgi:hypothetical protein
MDLAAKGRLKYQTFLLQCTENSIKLGSPDFLAMNIDCVAINAFQFINVKELYFKGIGE